MVCPVQNSENASVLLDYCARRLDPQTMAAFARHMASCPECSRFAEAQEKVWSALDAWDAEPVSAGFDENLYARISAEERRSFWSRMLGERFSWKPALSFGATCATLAFAVVLNLPERQQTAVPPTILQPAAQVDALEPEQIERSIEDYEMLRQFSTPAQTI